MNAPDAELPPPAPAASRLYRVVLWSPVIFALSTALWLLMLSVSGSGGSLMALLCGGSAVLIVVCVLPIALFVQLVRGLIHRESLVRWHTGQWLIINGLGGGVGLFLLIIFYRLPVLPLAWLAVVYGLNWWGDRQVARAECWLRDFFGATRPAAAPSPNRPIRSLRLGVLLKEFRTGTPSIRQAALRELEQLGEVEEF